ncbi:P-loop containing nucleoside triphosphate hydrolase protein [Myriangium duriaei CBS 260.36]|uniref:Kinesin-like protein n=1 Tax=Myriangium duriaei CBS 260.36 TaxID=1168546 RepID=A0A9P4MFD6_9PEZI|nr:P-loop containing nucleoside triphosphate hydrolase protein [Myriangium duriaei CBS 260.36]
MTGDYPSRSNAALFDVYLRLRPSYTPGAERFLDVEATQEGDYPTHITIKPPANDHRKRAIEKFEFTKVFQEDAAQLDLFQSTGVPEIIEGVVGKDRGQGRDGLLATLGVTGSGKSHTILGSKTQRGLTQLSLDVLFQSIQSRIVDTSKDDDVLQSLTVSDVSEAQMMTASNFLELTYGDGTASTRASRATSRAATPMMDMSFVSGAGANMRKHMPRLSTLPQYPEVQDIQVDCDTSSQYAVVISMYEVYNDRIFDLLISSSSKSAIQKRRGLLFKSTELSPDRKVVAGLRKIICSSLEEALLVLETGLVERRVAGTGSNAVSSRSHGFFCVEVRKRPERSISCTWKSSSFTIVDLAGSERARSAKTTGSTLAEAGKINESLMYLGQCMQLQSDNSDLSKPSIVPFRQCKLTELLFSNSFPSSSASGNTALSLRNHPHLTNGSSDRRNPQKSVMVVTADPLGDFNATSQILRYSALAREVTVPRVPSVTSSIIAGAHGASVPGKASGRSSPTASSEDLEAALAEIGRLRAELDIVSVRYDEEVRRRREAEASWSAATERCEMIENEVRDEMWGEFEARLEMETRRWRAAAEEESERNDQRMDQKLDILARGIEVQVYEDPAATEDDKVRELEDENERLKRKVEELSREKGLRSPSKKMRVLKTRKWEGSGIGFEGSP